MRLSRLAAPYLPRKPAETILYKLVQQHLESLLAYAREHYEGGLPRYVEQEFRAYLACGDFSRGFTRLSCDACGHELLVSFSCGRRAASARPAPAGAWQMPALSWSIESSPMFP